MIFKISWTILSILLGWIIYKECTNYLIQTSKTDSQEESTQEEQKPIMYIILPNSEPQ